MKSIPLVLAGLLAVSCSTVHHVSSTPRLLNEGVRVPAAQTRPTGIYVAVYELQNGELREALGRSRVEYVQDGFRIVRSRSSFTKTMQGIERFDLPQRGFKVKNISLEILTGNSLGMEPVSAHKIEYSQSDVEKLLANSPGGFELVVLKTEGGTFESFSYPFENGPFRKYYRGIRDNGGPGNGDGETTPPITGAGDFVRPSEQQLLTSAHYENLLKKLEKEEVTVSQLEEFIQTQLLWNFEQFEAALAQSRSDSEVARKVQFYRSQFDIFGKIALQIGRLIAGEPFARKLQIYKQTTFPLDVRKAGEIATRFFADPTKLDAADQEKLYPELSRRNAAALAVTLATFHFKETSDRSTASVVRYLRNLVAGEQQDQFLSGIAETTTPNLDDLKLIARAAPDAGRGIFLLYQNSIPSTATVDLIPLARILQREGNHTFLNRLLDGKQSLPFDEFVAICGGATYYSKEYYLMTFRGKIAERDSGTRIKLARLLTREENHRVLEEYLTAQSRISFQELQALAGAANYYGKEHYLFTFRQKLIETDARTFVAFAGLLTRENNHAAITEYLSRQTQLSYADLNAVASAANYYSKEHYLFTFRLKMSERDIPTAATLARQLTRENNHAFIDEFLRRQTQISFADLNAFAAAANYYSKEHYVFNYRQKIAERDLATTITLARQLTRENNHAVITEYISANPRMSRNDLEQLASAANYYSKEHYLQLRR